VHLYHTALTCRAFAQIAIPELWREFVFTLSDEDAHRRTYQIAFLDLLSVESSVNFVHTKKLTLHLSMRSSLIADLSKCAEIKSLIDKFIQIYKHAAPHLRTLSLKVEPFIPSDCAHDGLWPLLHCCNDSIYYCLGLIVNRESDFATLNLDVGREVWAFDIEYRPHLQQILWMMGPKITSLEISETPQFLQPFLPRMQRLRKINIRNASSPQEEDSVGAWKAISRLHLKKIVLSGFSHPRNLQGCVSQTLTRLALNGLDDVVDAAVVCYTQLSQLVVCALNWGKVKDPDVARTTIIPNTVCTKLLQVYFLDSFVPTGIISTIAKSNPNLDFCGAPPNISDQDLFHLRNYCPQLRVILMSDGTLDDLTPLPLITPKGLAEIPYMRRLQSLRLHHSLLCHINESLLLSIARNNIILSRLRISLQKDRLGKWVKPDIHASLSVSDEFREWFIDSVLPTQSRAVSWEISLDALRVKVCQNSVGEAALIKGIIAS
jgi:hypothetical protein